MRVQLRISAIAFLLVYSVSNIAAQIGNDQCDGAEIITPLVSDGPFVCVQGITEGAQPELLQNACSIEAFPTVWYQVITDNNAALINIQVQSEEFDAPTISLFQQITDCSNLNPVPLTQSNLSCLVGNNGEAEALATDVSINQVYYIAVSSFNSLGGLFEICVNTISQASACVTSRDIEITGRSSGGPFEGPFFPGETVSICFNVNSYTAANNGCQWFQGIVPVFGNGWDPSSFDADGQPLGATINGVGMGVPGNGLYNTSIWDWFANVDYHYDHPFYQVGDLDGNGTLDMCNLLYDPDCPVLGGLMGGCCGPCWGAPQGTILPPGWFAYGVNGTCPTPGPPIGLDWGDGPSCGGGHGPWSFCFDLKVRDNPDCLNDPSRRNIELGFFTFADGEVGSWTGNASVCALDQPAKLTLPMCCSEHIQSTEVIEGICSNQFFEYSLNEPNVEYWEWTIIGGPVTGANAGYGPAGQLIIDTLINPGIAPQSVEYILKGYTGACQLYTKTIQVTVYPEIISFFNADTFCSTSPTPYTLTPNISGGSGNYQYNWSPNGETTSSINISNLISGTTYAVTIADDVGCISTASVVPHIYTSFQSTIIAPITEQCAERGPISIAGIASGGMGPYDYNWMLPTGANIMSQQIISNVSGLHLLSIEDSEGCISMDSVVLTVNAQPELSISTATGSNVICEGGSTTINAMSLNGTGPFNYFWVTPSGPSSGVSIQSSIAGSFSVMVEDTKGCMDTLIFELTTQAIPAPDLGPDISTCQNDGSVNIGVLGVFEDYTWSAGIEFNGQQNILVTEPGIYTVTVTDENGCTGDTNMELTFYPQPNFPLPDTFQLNPLGSLTINADQYGGLWQEYIWEQCANCTNSILITQSGEYSITVIDANGCQVSDTFIVTKNLDKPKENYLVTPNGDNVNDILIIEGIEFFPNNELIIVNRWGDVVYEAKPYVNDWGGEGSNGGLLSQGTYYFILRGVGAQLPQGGYIVILK